MKKILLIITLALIMSGCMKASYYGTITPLENGKKNIVSLGNSEQDSLQKALKAAELTCKEAQLTNGFVTYSTDTKYIGMFASGDQQKTVSGVMGVASAMLGSAGTASKSTNVYSSSSTSGNTTTNKSASVGAGVNMAGASDSLTNNSYQTTLSIKCNQ